MWSVDIKDFNGLVDKGSGDDDIAVNRNVNILKIGFKLFKRSHFYHPLLFLVGQGQFEKLFHCLS